MNNITSVHLYFLFALTLCLVGYKLTQGVKLQFQEARAQQAAQIEQLLSSVE